MIHPFIFLLDILTVLLFVLTLAKQFSLQSHYKNLNGLRYHRLAYIGITLSTTIAIIIRILIQSLDYNGYYAIESDPLMLNLALVIAKLLMATVALFSYLWFKGSKFKFLKIFDKWI